MSRQAGAAERKAAMASLEHAPCAVTLGFRIVSADNGEAVARMPFDRKLLNAGGDEAPTHGGAIASLADFAACAAVWSLPETERSATISITVNFLSPAIKDDLVARATVRRKGRNVASLTVEVRNRAGELVADALVTYKIA